MALWTPSDLTNSQFIQQQLTPTDRNNALSNMQDSLSRMQPILSQLQTQLSQAETETNPGGQLSFSNVKKARDEAQAAQNNPNLTGAQKAQAQQQYENLQQERDAALSAQESLLGKITQQQEAINTAQVAVTNLQQAGATPPGTNVYEPTGDQPLARPAEVESQNNPNPTPEPINSPTTPPEIVENSEPESVDAEYNDTGELVDLNTGQVYNVDPESGFVENSTGLLISPEDIEADYNEKGELVDFNTGQVYDIDEESGFLVTEGGLLVSPEDIANEPGYGDEDTEEPLTEFTVGPDAPYAQGSSKGLPGATQNAQAQATLQDTANFQAKADWRVRLSLAPGATYLYKASPVAGILQPLQATDGVIFPYTPTVSVQYSASYDQTNLVHSNYKVYQYSGSNVDSINITCDFTAQDTQEANYLLAVIHFFRSMTKMFYGQDDGPKPGTPPPLCYLSGLGAYQFDAHPLAITGFTYNLPNDVDYIRADIVTGASLPGVNTSSANSPNNTTSASQGRLSQGGSNLSVGGVPAATQFPAATNPAGSKEPTYVPTKIQLSIAAIPMMSRNQMSNDFSLKEYAKGTLLRGSKRSKPGVW